MLRKGIFFTGCAILISLALFVTIGPYFSPYYGQSSDFTRSLLPPMTAGHVLGTDRMGNDVLTALMTAGRISLTVSFCAVTVELFFGVFAGLLAGYCGGVFNRFFTLITDVMLSLPTLPVLLLASALASDFSFSGAWKMVFVGSLIGFLSAPTCARLVRGQTLQLRAELFIGLLQASGLSSARIVMRHVLPHIVPQLVVTAALGVGDAIIAESVLSFLGLGISAPQSSWGSMIRVMTRPADFQNRPWLWLGAGGCIFIAVLGFTLLGEGLNRKELG